MSFCGRNIVIRACVVSALLAAGGARAQEPVLPEWSPEPAGAEKPPSEKVRTGGDDFPVIADLRLFEVEFGVGVNAARRRGGMKARAGSNLFVELRMNRPQPFDLALQLKGTNFTHATDSGGNVTTVTINPSFFVDYNLRVNGQTNLFAGVGFGGAFVQNKSFIATGTMSGKISNGGGRAFAITPRIGISVLNFLRITAEYSFTARDYSYFGVNVGVTLGGSYKNAVTNRRSRRERFRDNVNDVIRESVEEIIWNHILD